MFRHANIESAQVDLDRPYSLVSLLVVPSHIWKQIRADSAVGIGLHGILACTCVLASLCSQQHLGLLEKVRSQVAAQQGTLAFT